jgi:hypothetical protein
MISHLGSMIPVARARARRLQDGTDAVALAFIGEGATSQGDFHEAINLAGVMKLPMILVVENNRYAFSTPLDEQYACARLSDRAVGYGIAGETVDGTDFDAVWAAITARRRGPARADGADAAGVHAAAHARATPRATAPTSSSPPPRRSASSRWTRCPRFEAVAGRPRPRRRRPPRRPSRPSPPSILEDAVERALAAPEPDPSTEAWRSVFAPGEAADAFARQHAEVNHG